MNKQTKKYLGKSNPELSAYVKDYKFCNSNKFPIAPGITIKQMIG